MVPMYTFTCLFKFGLNVDIIHQIRSYIATRNKGKYEKPGKEADEWKRQEEDSEK